MTEPPTPVSRQRTSDAVDNTVSDAASDAQQGARRQAEDEHARPAVIAAPANRGALIECD